MAVIGKENAVMSEPLISIIVPIYKVEQYIDKCVESILHQSYENIEVILVDDGSPDNCGRLCDEYAKRDGRIKVIHKENGGLSDARNAGIDISEGDYIGFVDSDDYILPEMYEELYKLLKETDSDIAVCRALKFKDGTEIKKEKTEAGSAVYTGDGILNALFERKIDNYAWNKLYKRELFDDIRYPYRKIYEDLFTTYKLCAISSSVVVTDDKLYCYRLRDDSIMGMTRTRISTDKFEAYYGIDDYFESNVRIRDGARKYMYSELVSDVFKIVRAGTVSENKEFFKELKHFLKQVKPTSKKDYVFLNIAAYATWSVRLRYAVQRTLGK